MKRKDQDFLNAAMRTNFMVFLHRDKVERLYVQQDKFAQGLVVFPRAAPYLPDLRTELLSFPQAKTDDIVDSITQALAYQDDDNAYDSTMSWVGDTDVPYRGWGGRVIG